MGTFRQIILTTSIENTEIAQELIKKHVLSTSIPIHVIAGGKKRQDSSRLALEFIESLGTPPERTLIHDACRPMLTDAFLERIKTHLMDRSYGAWIPVVPVIDTLKQVENSQVVATVDRSAIQRVQTPQIFEYSVLHDLFQRAKEDPNLEFTDDAALCEFFGIPVGVFQGDPRNIKLTYHFEMETLRLMLTELRRSTPCVSELDTTSTV